ncbi:CAP domain-containing protein [Streptomyces sp. NPDC005017]|uniref:CAP domain-containing protein n=1 Tax=Streptomyces sp. NPDC005017 TaxID=3364706 RepID=UPI0036B376FB
MTELVPGGNLALPRGTLTVRVPGPFDVSALITDDGGRVGGDADFVFYNQPAAPGARLGGDTLTLDPGALRSGATRVTVVVSPADPDTPLSRLPSPALQVSGTDGRSLARFAPPRPRTETVLLLAEIYRRGDTWKVRALGQGYAEGLAGVARDFGVDVVESEAETAPVSVGDGPAPVGAAPTVVDLRVGPAVSGHRAGPDDTVTADAWIGPVNSARARAGAPRVTWDARLAAAAREHAATMAAAGRLGVEGRDGLAVYQRVTRTGYAYVSVGEHLVSGPRTPQELLGSCLRTDHARRILHDAVFTHAALGRATGGGGGDVFWTALWARPLGPGDLARTEAEVVALTNRERASAGLPPLAADPLLTRAAQAHSADMVARDFYSHTSPEGSGPRDRAVAVGAVRRSTGENIACGQRSAAEVVTGWMNSPGHRANILRPEFTHIGIGFAGGGRAGTYWTQLFGA